MNHGYTYQDVLAASQRIDWRVEDLIGGDRCLDFTKPFMPESLARVEALNFLTPREQMVLNQIRGHNYLSLFGLVEEFILPFVLDHARPQLNSDDYRIRALLQFASEEAKHIHLFKSFRTEFEAGFGMNCPVIGPVIGPAEDIAKAVLAHEPLSVALLILQIEWMTQSHYVDSVHDDRDLDPLFRSLLKHHWMEEAQHAKLDTLMVEALADGRGVAELVRATEGYLMIGGMFDAALKTQTELDLGSFEQAVGRRLGPADRDMFISQQHQANRWTYLGSGMIHPKFVRMLRAMCPEAANMVARVAPAFC
jgi:hypothetical protein